MRASFLVDVGRMELRDVPDPKPGPHDALLEVSAVGVCGTDFHIYSGESNYNLDDVGRPVPLSTSPQILGHEVTGIVRELGAEARGLSVGDRVVVDQGINCSSTRRTPLCEYCATGDSHQCEHYTEHGITGLPGGFADFLSIPAVNAVPVTAPGVSFTEAALTEPLGCVLHSSDCASRAASRYRIGAKDPAERVQSVLICGAGPAGQLFLQVLRKVIGFEGLVLVTEPDPKKRALAEASGAETIDPMQNNLAEAVLERTGGRRVEYLIEATGSGPLFGEIPSVIRKQATVLLYGIGHGGASLELLNQVQWKEPALVLSVGASGGFDADGRPKVYRRALQLIEGGTIDVASLVTHRYMGLDSVSEAFNGTHAAPGYVKGVVQLGGAS